MLIGSMHVILKITHFYQKKFYLCFCGSFEVLRNENLPVIARTGDCPKTANLGKPRQGTHRFCETQET